MTNSVSGPINVVRLEGSINNIKKVFYLFMDLHQDLANQTECPDIRSQYINDYLINQFDKSSQNIDFFVENFHDTSTYSTKFTEKYISKVRNMFNKIFKFDYKKNKVIRSKEFPNVRLHYMDIRSYFTFKVGDPFGIAFEIVDFANSIKNSIWLNDLTHIKSGMDIVNSQLKIVHDALFSSKSKTIQKSKLIRKYTPTQINYSQNEATKIIEYIIHKITHEYANVNIKKIINEIISSDLVTLFNNYTDISEKIYTFLDEAATKINYRFDEKIKYEGSYDYFGFLYTSIGSDIICELTKLMQNYSICIMDLYGLLMDLYFLRRALDKDYITNSIVYTGAFHSANYIKYLVGKFDFKITHAFYSDIPDINSLNKKIASLENTNSVLGLFYPPTLHQCVDMSIFPDNFQ